VSVFLATTALREFWDERARLVFLDLPPDRWMRRADPGCDVLPNPWLDRERFQTAATYLDRCGEDVLATLAEYLNRVHGRSCSLRYWRVLLGNWLLNYLHATYDRFVRLNDAFARYPDLQTTVLAPECFRVPTRARDMIVGLKNSDLLNLQLISQLLLAMGHSFESRQPNDARRPSRTQHGGGRRAARRSLHQIAERLARSVRASGPDAILYRMEIMDHATAWRLALASGFHIVPMALRPPGPEIAAVLDDRRLGLAALRSDDTFQRVALQCMPQYLPTFVLEGYEATRTRALAGWRRMPRVIVTATGWNYDEAFQLFAAEASETGSTLMGVQHGAGYGYSREWPSERHERRSSDAYIAWGWADDEAGADVSNLPNPKLSRFCAAPRRPRGRRVQTLFVSAGNKQYQTRFNSSPQGALNREYFGGQLRFLAALTEPARRAMRFRPRPGVAHPLRQQIAQTYAELGWDEGRTYYESLADASFVVVDHPGSAMLEPLAADVPTILFWNPCHWEMRPAAQPYFDLLREARILHDSPEAAARHFHTVMGEESGWWRKPSVRRARQAFIRRFALVDTGWQASWLAHIRAEAAAAERVATMRIGDPDRRTDYSVR
jgi:putative transferase (TIGR04331 family)